MRPWRVVAGCYRTELLREPRSTTNQTRHRHPFAPRIGGEYTLARLSGKRLSAFRRERRRGPTALLWLLSGCVLPSAPPPSIANGLPPHQTFPSDQIIAEPFAQVGPHGSSHVFAPSTSTMLLDDGDSAWSDGLDPPDATFLPAPQPRGLHANEPLPISDRTARPLPDLRGGVHQPHERSPPLT